MFLISLLVATFASMLIGFIWYHPKIFGTEWAESQGLKSENMQPKITDILLEGFLAFIVAFFLAIFIEWTASQNSLDGALVGFFVAIGFVIPTLFSQSIWIKKPLKTTLITSGNNLIRLTLMGGLIGLLI